MISRSNIIAWVLAASVALALFACATSDRQHSAGSDRGDDTSGKQSSRNDSDAGEDEFYVSGNLDTMTVSLRNNPLTSKRIDRRDAAEFASKLQAAIKASRGDDRKAQVALMSLRRIAGEGIGAVLESARELVAFEMKKDVNRGIPEFAKLELVLAAIQAKKYSYAEYFLDELFRSKNKKVQAAAFTAEGIIAAEDGRMPEAVESWSKALAADPSYEAALLNIGFMSLKFGDLGRARKMLGGLQGDWFAAYGLITVERLTKDVSKANDLCRRLLDSKPRYKPAIFNCALNEFQGNNNADKALALLDKMTKIPGNNNWDERAYTLKMTIEEAKGRVRPVKRDEGKTKK